MSLAESGGFWPRSPGIPSREPPLPMGPLTGTESGVVDMVVHARPPIVLIAVRRGGMNIY